MEQIVYYLPLLMPLLLLVMAIVLFSTSKGKRGRKTMALLQLNGVVFTTCSWFFITNQMDIYLFLYGVSVACLLWIVPLIYCYIKCFVGTKIKGIVLHFVPGLLLGLITTFYLLFWAQPAETKIFFDYLSSGVIGGDANMETFVTIYMLAILLVGLQLIGYGFTFAPTIKKYKLTLEREYGNIDRFRIFWVYVAFILFTLMSVWILVNRLYPIYSFPYNSICLLGTFTIILLFMGIRNKLQRYPVLVKQAGWEQSFDTDREAEQLALNKLLHVFKVEQPFFKEDVNITDLSKQIAVDRNYMVSVINAQINMNFNMFVDKYRVNYMKKYKADNPNVKPKKLMKLAGFTSVKTFKNALKRL